MSCGTPSPVLPSQVWKSSGGNTGHPEHHRDSPGGDEQNLLTQGAPSHSLLPSSCCPAQDQSHPWILWHSPVLPVELQAGDVCGTGSAGTAFSREGTKCFCQPVTSQPGSVVRFSRTPGPLCWAAPQPAPFHRVIQVQYSCGCLTLKFQSTFSFRLLRSFWTAAVPSSIPT